MQVVGYEPGTPSDPAAIRLADEGDVETHRLDPGRSLSFGLGDRHCAGSIEDSTHESCGKADAPYCDTHTTIWPCARCRGTCSMPLDTCHEAHALYLAAFEPATFKVGVTRPWRLETRLAEQGASRGVHIRTVENGRKARQIEAEMAAEIPDRVAVEQKTEGLARDLERDVWKRFIEPYTIQDRFEFDYGISISQQPIQATKLDGTISGSRGRILVLEQGATPYAVDLKSLVGYEIAGESASSDRQSSLGAF